MDEYEEGRLEAKRVLTKWASRWIAIWLLVVLFIVTGLMYAIPKYRVWQRELSGQARLREASWSRQIKIEEAKAINLSADELAAAEIKRARGVAEANAIIGQSLKGNESYLRYLWVQGLNDGNSEVIYVATEANMPILEAGRMVK